jgi:hypothetical protein
MNNLIGRKVYVYYNLHKKKWSVKDWDTKRVIAHVHTITLQDCDLKVSKKGRLRVLKEKRKNVHAGILGTIVLYDTSFPKITKRKEITYNPYKYDSFVYTMDTAKVRKANIIHMSYKQLWEL